MSTSGSAEGIQLIADERSFLRIVPAMVISRWKVLSLLVLQTEICEWKKKKKVDSIFPFEQKMIELTFLWLNLGLFVGDVNESFVSCFAGNERMRTTGL